MPSDHPNPENWSLNKKGTFPPPSEIILKEFYNHPQGHSSLTNKRDKTRIPWDFLLIKYKAGQRWAWKDNRKQAVHWKWDFLTRVFDRT